MRIMTNVFYIQGRAWDWTRFFKGIFQKIQKNHGVKISHNACAYWWVIIILDKQQICTGGMVWSQVKNYLIVFINFSYLFRLVIYFFAGSTIIGFSIKVSVYLLNNSQIRHYESLSVSLIVSTRNLLDLITPVLNLLSFLSQRMDKEVGLMKFWLDGWS